MHGVSVIHGGGMTGFLGFTSSGDIYAEPTSPNHRVHRIIRPRLNQGNVRGFRDRVGAVGGVEGEGVARGVHGSHELDSAVLAWKLVHARPYTHCQLHGTRNGGFRPRAFAVAGFRSIRPLDDIRSSTVARVVLPLAFTLT